MSMVRKSLENLAIVIHSCDKYSFVWERWAESFKKYFIAKDINVYFLSEEKRNLYLGNDPCFRSYQTGPGEWSDRLSRFLAIINENYIFYMQEDMFPKTHMITWHFKLYKMLLENANLDALQVSPNCQYYKLETSLFGNPINIKLFADDSNYLVSHQPRLWRKSFLSSCLESGESPWVNEIKGTERIRKLNPIIGLLEWDWYDHMVKKGKWIE